jgi:AhpD family alkylhydroperoxidase
MEARISYQATTGVRKVLLQLESYIAECGLNEKLANLIRLRVSQVNGCAYCIDMHWKDLRAAGESEQRLYGLDAWRESPYYSDKERAALRWAEALTRVADGHVSDADFEVARGQFSEEELLNLSLAVGAINIWNRLNIAFRTPAGGYQPSKRATAGS